MATRRGPGLDSPGTPQTDPATDDHRQSTVAPRPVVEIRAELLEIAREAWTAGRVVDPHRLSRLADELTWAASFARLFGGDATATEQFAAKVEETAELAALLRDRAREVAA